jgi:hypothetical protein
VVIAGKISIAFLTNEPFLPVSPLPKCRSKPRYASLAGWCKHKFWYRDIDFFLCKDGLKQQFIKYFYPVVCNQEILHGASSASRLQRSNTAVYLFTNGLLR